MISAWELTGRRCRDAASQTGSTFGRIILVGCGDGTGPRVVEQLSWEGRLLHQGRPQELNVPEEELWSVVDDGR